MLIIAVLLFVISLFFCLGIGFALIYLALYSPIEPPESIKPFVTEHWRVIFLGSGVSLFLTIPSFYILTSMESRFKSIYNTVAEISIAIIITVVAASFFLLLLLAILHPALEEQWKFAMVFIGLSYLLYIPHFFTWYMGLLLTYRRFKLAVIKYRAKVKLNMIEHQVKELERKISKYETTLNQRNEIEQKIRTIIAFDPSNLSVKALALKEKAQMMTNDEINSRKTEISLELPQIINLREVAEKRLKAIENENRSLKLKLEDIDSKLQELEIKDPANFQIKMQRLQPLEKMKLEDLENIKPTGDIEKLFYERILLRFQIKDKCEELENAEKEVFHAKLKELSLRMENLILDLETVDRKIKSEEPHLLELRNTLNKLKEEKERIMKSLSNSN
jgi:hypothetical protein